MPVPNKTVHEIGRGITPAIPFLLNAMTFFICLKFARRRSGVGIDLIAIAIGASSEAKKEDVTIVWHRPGSQCKISERHRPSFCDEVLVME